MMSAFAVPMWTSGRCHLAVQIGQNEVRKPYRPTGLHFRLSNMIFSEFLANRGVDLCFGVAIQEARDLSTALMGFEEVGPIHKLVRIVNPLPHLRKLWKLPLPRWGRSPLSWRLRAASTRALRGCSVTPFDHFGEAHQDAWRRYAGRGVMTCRDAEYLEWRYVDCPLGHYSR